MKEVFDTKSEALEFIVEKRRGEKEIQSLEDWEKGLEEEVEKDIESDVDRVNDMEDISLDDLDGRGRAIPKGAYVEEEELEVRKKQIERIIKQKRVGLSGQYERKKKRGKLEMRQAMKSQHNGNTNIFKKYRRDRRGETELAVVILVDRSGSMAGRDLKQAYGTSWCVREALQDTGNQVCEIAFNSSFDVLRDWNGEGDYDLSSEGSTNPGVALNEAKRKLKKILVSEEKLNPLVIVITDGRYGAGNVESEVHQLRKEMDARVAEITLYERGDEDERRRIYDYVRSCTDMDGLHGVIESILTEVENEFLDERYQEVR